MAWIPVAAAGISAAGSLGAAMMSRSGAREANASNVNLNAENRAWQERMSGSEVQRRVADLKAAGLNPMLAYSGSASTPSTSPAQVENVEAESSRHLSSGVSSAAALASTLKLQAEQAKAVAAQGDASAAQAAKTRLETLLLAPSEPFSAKNAEIQHRMLKSQLDNLNATFDNIVEQTAGLMDENERKRQMFILQKDYQSYLNKAAELGIPEAQAEADFYRTLGPGSKTIGLFRELLELRKGVK